MKFPEIIETTIASDEDVQTVAILVLQRVANYKKVIGKYGSPE
jgi:hypothetical protein